MKTIDAYGDLKSMNQPIVTTREAATRMETSTQNAGRRLRALEGAGLAQKLRHGLWLLDAEIGPFAVAPYLTTPFPSYVSFWSALSFHDMIEQIPRQISVAALDRARRIETTVGTFVIHHLAPEVFGGFEGTSTSGYVARPEKALFDTVYVRSASGSKAYFTEMTIPAGFDHNALEGWINRIGSKRLMTTVARRIDDLLRQTDKSV